MVLYCIRINELYLNPYLLKRKGRYPELPVVQLFVCLFVFFNIDQTCMLSQYIANLEHGSRELGQWACAVKVWWLQQSRGSLWPRCKLTKLSPMVVQSAHGSQLSPLLKMQLMVLPEFKVNSRLPVQTFPGPGALEDQGKSINNVNIRKVSASVFFLGEKITWENLTFQLGFLKLSAVVPFPSAFSQPMAKPLGRRQFKHWPPQCPMKTSSNTMCSCKISPTSICDVLHRWLSGGVNHIKRSHLYGINSSMWHTEKLIYLLIDPTGVPRFQEAKVHRYFPSDLFKLHMQ